MRRVGDGEEGLWANEEGVEGKMSKVTEVLKGRLGCWKGILMGMDCLRC